MIRGRISSEMIRIHRVFLNLWFAKPMVCMRVAFHENDGNHENDENDEDNSDSYKQGVECWIRGNHGNHGNDENHGNPGCKPQVPQTTGLEIPEFRPKVRVTSQKSEFRTKSQSYSRADPKNPNRIAQTRPAEWGLGASTESPPLKPS